MLPGGSKDRSAKQDGYFAEKFDRVMEGEAYTDPVRMRRQARLKENQRMLSKAFIPNNGYKEMSVASLTQFNILNQICIFFFSLSGTV